MKNNDKILAAFLASMGLFSAIQSVQYIKTLSSGEKKDLMSVVLIAQDVAKPDCPVGTAIDGSKNQGDQRIKLA